MPASSAPTSAIAGVLRTPVGIVVLPSLRRVVTATERGTIDTFDSALRPRASFRVCPEPRWLVGDEKRGRVIVGCHDPKLRGDDDGGEVAFVDVRSSTVVGRARHVSLLTVAALDASPRHLVYIRTTGSDTTRGTLARYDPMTAARVDSFAVPGFSGDRYRLVPGDDATPMIVVDHDGDRVVAIDSSGSPLVLTVGRRRLPTDAALDGHRLMVALSAAGSVAELDLDQQTHYRAVPACDTPASVVIDRSRGHVFAFCVESIDGRDAFVVSLDDPGGGHTLRTIHLGELVAFPDADSWVELDAKSGRLVVATKRRVDVVDPAGASFGIDLQQGTGITGLALDTTSGNAYAAIRGLSGGAIARIPVRGAAPTSPPPYGKSLPKPVPEVGAWFGFDNDDPQPAYADAPGLRSPTALAVHPDGTLTVAERFSPTLGSFVGGAYREERIASIAPPHEVVYDTGGSLWFSEATAADIGSVARLSGKTAKMPGTIARRDADGRITEFPLPAFADKIVAADDGIYWFSAYPASLVGRIARDGSAVVRSVQLGKHANGPRELIDIAAAPDGGCYVLYDDALVRVRIDGSQSLVPDFLVPEPKAVVAGFATAVAVLSDGSVAVAIRRQIVRYDRSGARRLYQPLPDRQMFPKAGSFRGPCELTGLASGPNASVWGVCGDSIVAVPASGPARIVTLPVAQSSPRSLVQTPDGSMWFAEPTQSRLGRIAPDGTLTETTI